jgi:hypothetical protein
MRAHPQQHSSSTTINTPLRTSIRPLSHNSSHATPQQPTQNNLAHSPIDHSPSSNPKHLLMVAAAQRQPPS